MAQKTDIKIKLDAEGEGHLVAALGRVRAASAKIRAPLSADVKTIAAITASINKIGLAAAGVSAAGIASIVTTLKQARNVARETSSELAELSSVASGLNIADAIDAGALAFAAQSAGWDGVGDLTGIGGALMSASLDVRSGSEDMIDAFNAIGVHFEDLFRLDSSSGDYRAELRGIDDILENMARRADRLSKHNLTELLIPIVGDTDAQKLAAFLKMSSSEIERQQDVYRALTGAKKSDIEASAAYQDSLASVSTSLLGLRVAFSRDLYPVLQSGNEKFSEFAVRNQARFQKFGGLIAGYMADLEPALIHAADLALAVISGDGASLEASPLKAAFEALVQLVSDFSSGVLDLLSYLNLGETDAPWLQKTLSFLGDTRDAAVALIDTISKTATIINDDIAPAIGSMIGWIDELMTSMGIGETGDQIAIVAALILFKNTISGAIGLVAKLAGGLISLGGAAGQAAGLAGAGASAAAGVAVGGAAAGGAAIYAGMSYRDAARALDEAGREAEELAKMHGAAYAAAYLRAVVEALPSDHRAMGVTNKILGAVGLGFDFDGAKTELDLVISGGNADDAIAGAAAAFAQYGWPVSPGGQVEIGAGITIDAMTFAPAIEGRLREISASMSVPSDVSSGASVPYPTPQPSQTPVIIQLPSGERVSGLSASDDAISRLSRSASLSRRASS